MSVVYLTTTGSQLRRRGDNLQLWRKNEKLAEVRLFDLERLVIVGSVQLTTQAIGLLLDRGVVIAFLTGRGRLRGTLVSGTSRNVFLRLAQVDRFKDAAFRLAFGRELVRAKLGAQERLLSRYARNHPGMIDGGTVERIRRPLDRVYFLCSRGRPGAASAVTVRRPTERRVEGKCPYCRRSFLEWQRVPAHWRSWRTMNSRWWRWTTRTTWAR